MDKIKGYLKTIQDKWGSLSKKKKLVAITASTGIIIVLILIAVFTTRTEYATLFSNMDPQDSAKVIDKLDTDKIKYKIDGTKILVPKDKVDKLKLSLLSGDVIPPSHKGFEIFDNASKFGVTDTEAKVMYQRALSGEIAKTIESIDGIEKAEVNLVMPDDSVFATQKDNASASILVKLKPGVELNPSQIKAIIALVSRGVKNLPKENVEVSDQYGNLLSDAANGDNLANGTISTPKQMEQEKLFETRMQNDIKAMLEKVFGKNKVAVKINADLDFDSKQITTIKYDPNKVERSIQKKTETTKDSTGQDMGGGPVDNNMSNQAESTSNQSAEASRNEETINYEIPEVKENVISAPGEVRRLSVSVVVDGMLSDDEKRAVNNIVAAASGYDEKRGDSLNIESIPFNDDDIKKQEQLAKEQLQKEEFAKKVKNYSIVGAIAAGIILLVLIFIRMRKRRISSEEEIIPLDKQPGNTVDVLVGDTALEGMQGIDYKPVLSEAEEEVMDIEKEIRSYAERKPDQVAEVIRTWLAEDER